MNVNKLDLTAEEAKAILADERLILASREEVEEGQAAIAEAPSLRASLASAEERAAKAEKRLVEEREEWAETVRSELADNQTVRESLTRNYPNRIGSGLGIYHDIAGEFDAAIAQRDDLAATVAGLRGALEAIYFYEWDSLDKRTNKMITDALAASPADHAARIQAAALEQLAAKFDFPGCLFPEVAIAARYEAAQLLGGETAVAADANAVVDQR